MVFGDCLSQSLCFFKSTVPLKSVFLWMRPDLIQQQEANGYLFLRLQMHRYWYWYQHRGWSLPLVKCMAISHHREQLCKCTYDSFVTFVFALLWNLQPSKENLLWWNISSDAWHYFHSQSDLCVLSAGKYSKLKGIRLFYKQLSYELYHIFDKNAPHKFFLIGV